jgi:hypothetical protein
VEAALGICCSDARCGSCLECGADTLASPTDSGLWMILALSDIYVYGYIVLAARSGGNTTAEHNPILEFIYGCGGNL